MQAAAVPDQGEGVAADAVGGGLDDGEGDRGGDGGVYRVAAKLQHLQAGLRRQGLAGGDDTLRRDDRMATGAIGFDDRSMGGDILPPMGGSAGVRDGAACALRGRPILPNAFAPPMVRAERR